MVVVAIAATALVGVAAPSLAAKQLVLFGIRAERALRCMRSSAAVTAVPRGAGQDRSQPDMWEAASTDHRIGICLDGRWIVGQHVGVVSAPVIPASALTRPANGLFSLP